MKKNIIKLLCLAVWTGIWGLFYCPAETTKIHFEFPNQEFAVETVFIAGSFNNWLENVDGKIVTKVPQEYVLKYNAEEQVWETGLELEKGRYEYKYALNNDWWFCDPKNPTFLNEYGNSVIYVDTEEAQRPLFELKFLLEAPEAKAVYLAGDFNYWATQAVNVVTGKTLLMEEYKMESEGGNIFQKSIFLPVGRYEYKFIVINLDGLTTWICDPRTSLKTEAEKEEEQNSVLFVQEPAEEEKNKEPGAAGTAPDRE